MKLIELIEKIERLEELRKIPDRCLTEDQMNEIDVLENTEIAPNLSTGSTDV